MVYQAAAALTAWLPVLRTLPFRFRVYGSGREGVEGNLELRPFSAQGFVDDLRTARAVLAGGGFSLMSAAVHLGVPYFAVPLGQQYEQALNARYLCWLGYGDCAPAPERERLLRFLVSAEDCARALNRYPRQDNTLALACVDDVLRRIAAGEPRPDRLANAGMGCWEG